MLCVTATIDEIFRHSVYDNDTSSRQSQGKIKGKIEGESRTNLSVDKKDVPSI